MLQVLFVCDTDTSLSPLAVAIAKSLAVSEGLQEKVSFRSAGSHSGKTPRPPDYRVRKLLLQHNLPEPSSNSTPLTLAEILDSDLVVVMNEENFWYIKTLNPDINANTLRLLMEFTSQLGIREMPDPLMGEVSFEEAFGLLEKAARGLIDSLKRSYGL